MDTPASIQVGRLQNPQVKGVEVTEGHFIFVNNFAVQVKLLQLSFTLIRNAFHFQSVQLLRFT